MVKNLTSKNANKPAKAVIQESKAKKVAGDNFSFPEDLGDFYMSFQFYDYRNMTGGNLPAVTTNDGLTRNFFTADKSSVSRAVQSSKAPFARVSLPLPLQLIDSFRVAWADASTGLTGTLMSESLQGLGRTINGDFTTGIVNGTQLLSSGDSASLALTPGNFSDQIRKWTDSAKDNTAVQAVLAVGKEGLPSDLTTLIELSTGIATNPNLTVLFQGPTLKSHTFSWRLLPRTAEESKRIRKILGIFKRAMHPMRLNESTPGFLKYPSECLVEFHGLQNNFLFPMRPAIVEDISINYSPNGIPSFFQDTHEPTAIEFSVSVKETSYYLRDSFDNEDEYGSDGLQSGDLYTNNGDLGT